MSNNDEKVVVDSKTDLLKRAFIQIQSMESEIKNLKNKQKESIGIVGMACRFPGNANSVEDYWKNLVEGVDAITPFPEERWENTEFKRKDADDIEGKISGEQGGFISDVDKFDAKFFGISPREVEQMDPQHRLMLEVAWESFEDANIPMDELRGSNTGVFIGMATMDYYGLIRSQLSDHEITAYTGIGVTKSSAAGRISYTFGFTGPCMAVDTACSASLSALQLAVESLRSGDCDIALVGGVNLMLCPSTHVGLSQANMLAPDGRCKTFSDKADGYGRSEGCGMVVLKRISDARLNGDDTYAQIKGIAVNQDGASSGLTVPNGPAQVRLIKKVLEDARLEPNDVSYVEAHGTGTPMGDPIEVNALASAYCQSRVADNPLLVGSVKTNIGHLEAAAGMASLIKVAMSLKNRTIPAHLHLTGFNPNINWEKIPMVIPTENRIWESTGVRHAGVSAFGFAGTNVHAILSEELSVKVDSYDLDDGLIQKNCLFACSAKSLPALQDLAKRYVLFIESHPDENLENFCRSATQGRALFNYRFACPVANIDELKQRLTEFAEDPSSSANNVNTFYSIVKESDPEFAFMFTGQGAQFSGMAKQCSNYFPRYKQTITDCHNLLQSEFDIDLISLLSEQSQSANLDLTQFTQPALFAVEYALADLLLSWGIKPAVVMGHSVGEFVAATIAGVFTWQDGMRLIAHRGRLMAEKCQPGGMLAVMTESAIAEKLVLPHRQQLSVAAYNGPRQCVIAGASEELELVAKECERQGIMSRSLPVSHGFHSPLMQPMLEDFRKVLKNIKFYKPRIKIISNLSGDFVSEDIATPEYWVNHVMAPVCFTQSVNRLRKTDCRHVIEVGPQPILTALAKHTDVDNAVSWLPALTRTQDNLVSINSLLAQLLVSGCEIKWSELYVTMNGRAHVRLPKYPFQRQRHWFPKTAYGSKRTSSSTAKHGHPLLGELIKLPTAAGLKLFPLYFANSEQVYIQDHVVFGSTIVPGALYADAALSAAQTMFPHHGVVLKDFEISRALDFERAAKFPVQLTCTQDQEDASFSISSYSSGDFSDDAEWIEHAQGSISCLKDTHIGQQVDMVEYTNKLDEKLDLTEIYNQFANKGLTFGENFHSLQGLWKSDKEVVASFAVAEEQSRHVSAYRIHPVLLDACFQSLCAFPFGGADEIALPIGIEELKMWGRCTTDMWCISTMRPHEKDAVVGLADISILDAQGLEIASITGLQIMRTNAAAILKQIKNNAPEDYLYLPTWRQEKKIDAVKVTEKDNSKWLVICLDDGQPHSEAPIDNAWIAYSGVDQANLLSGDLAKSNVGHSLTISAPDQLDQQLSELITGETSIALIPGKKSLTENNVLAAHNRVKAILAITQSLLRAKTTIKQLALITRSAQVIDSMESYGGLDDSAVWGFGRVLMQEHPELNCKLIDLDAVDSPSSERLEKILQLAVTENQLAVRNDTSFSARLEKYKTAEDNNKIIKPNTPFRLGVSEYGSFNNLTPLPAARTKPANKQVEVEVLYAGLNFKDVLNVLGLLKEFAENNGKTWDADAPLGFECSGRIVAVGDDSKFVVGDEVLVINGNMSSHLTIDEAYVFKKPDSLTLAESAAIPTVFLTSYYSLVEIAKMQAGESVLIHAAAGGVGQAAIQLAKSRGVTVFATASPSKWAFLKAQGVEHVMNSRTLDYATEIMQITKGRGVDIVLNSLSGDFIPKNLEVMATNGRYIEIGKLGVWSTEEIAAVRQDVAYSCFDLQEMNESYIDDFLRMINHLLQEFNDQRIAPLPTKVFDVSESADAFRYLSQAKNIGKVVININDNTNEHSLSAPLLIKDDASYLISGGLGGLGLAIAEWAVEKGAKCIVLVGRRAPNDDAKEKIEAWQSRGVDVQVVSADIALQEDVTRLFESLNNLPPLRGIFHCAGVLDDGFIFQQNIERFEKVMLPKIDGGWNLHQASVNIEASQQQPLDHFVAFSSISSLLGGPGQANYAAANAYLDVLMQMRKVQGLAGTSINWGPWSELGMAARMESDQAQQLQGSGLTPLSPQQGIELLEYTMQLAVSGIAIVDAQWATLSSMAESNNIKFLSLLEKPKANKPKIERSSDILNKINTAPVSSRLDVLRDFIREELAKILSISEPGEIGLNEKVFDIGVDSLSAVELKKRMESNLQVKLRTTLLFDFPTVDAVATHVLFDLLKLGNAANAEDELNKDNRPSEPEKLIDDEYSDDEMREMLLEELNG